MLKAPEKPLHQILRTAAWMQVLSDPLRDRVMLDAYETSHEQRELVAARDDWPHSWMGVGDGLLKVVKVLRDGRVVQFTNVSTGGWVDEASMTVCGRRPYDIVAVRRTRIVHIPRETFRMLLRASYEFNHFIIGQLSQRVTQFMGRVEADRMTDPVARLAQAIVGLYNPVLHPGMSADIHLSQEELGDLAGLTRQRTNQAVKSLERDGVVVVRHGGLLVKDLLALRRFAESAR